MLNFRLTGATCHLVGNNASNIKNDSLFTKCLESVNTIDESADAHFVQNTLKSER